MLLASIRALWSVLLAVTPAPLLQRLDRQAQARAAQRAEHRRLRSLQLQADRRG